MLLLRINRPKQALDFIELSLNGLEKLIEYNILIPMGVNKTFY
jgi:hypothetical protein